jgi:hypothetical protein
MQPGDNRRLPAGEPPYHADMTAARDSLHRLVDQLSDDQVPDALRALENMTAVPTAAPWPPPWFGSITSGRSDTSNRVDEILAEGFGR